MTDFAATGIDSGGATGRRDFSSRTVRVAVLLGIERLLAQFGLELAPLLAEAGLPADTFHDPEHRAPIGGLMRLLVRCVDLTECPHFGVLLGERVQPSALGPAGRLMIGALSVERALRGLIMNLHLHGEAVVPALTVSIDSACLSVTPYAFHDRGGEQLEDLSLAIAANVLRFLCGPRWSPTLVTLAHREPADRRPYDAVFKAPLRFGADSTSLAFDPTWLAQRPDTSHPALFEMTADAPVAAARELDVPTRARRAVIACMAQGIVGADKVASFVGITKRTLNRRLAEHGTSTKELIVDVRIQIAQQLMRDTDLSIADIAAATCYSDPAAFSRAFSARVGVSPGVWRRQSTP